MRGVAVLITGLFVVTALTMLMGVMYEPILEIVVSSSAVEAEGMGGTAERIADTNLQWVPAIGLAYFLVWGVMWYFRRERMTGRR